MNKKNGHDLVVSDTYDVFLAFVSMGTFLLSTCTGLTINKRSITLLIENAVIIILFEGEPLTVLLIIALCNAFLKCGDGKGVYKVTPALERTMAFSCRTPGVEKHMI